MLCSTVTTAELTLPYPEEFSYRWDYIPENMDVRVPVDSMKFRQPLLFNATNPKWMSRMSCPLCSMTLDFSVIKAKWLISFGVGNWDCNTLDKSLNSTRMMHEQHQGKIFKYDSQRDKIVKMTRRLKNSGTTNGSWLLAICEEQYECKCSLPCLYLL